LALAIGANASVFGALNAVVLRPLEFPNTEGLFEITSLKDGKPVGTSPPDVKDFAAQGRTFEKIAVYGLGFATCAVSHCHSASSELDFRHEFQSVVRCRRGETTHQ
jgi:hypothetical protein